MSLGVLTRDENGKIRYVYMLDVAANIHSGAIINLRDSLKNNIYRTVTEQVTFYKDYNDDTYFCLTSFNIEGEPTAVFAHFQGDDVQIMTQYNITGKRVSFMVMDDIAGLTGTITYMYQVN
jgi:hypothetical protein